MAGLSLGSAQASLSAAKHPDVFGYLGVFSGLGKELDTSANAKTPYLQIFLSGGEFPRRQDFHPMGDFRVFPRRVPVLVKGPHHFLGVEPLAQEPAGLCLPS